MRWDTIVKAMPAVVRANMADYERARAEFSWSQARAELAGLPGGGLDIAHEAVGRHAARDRADAVAPRCVGRGGRGDRVQLQRSAVEDEPVWRPAPSRHWSAPWLTRRASSKPRARTAPAALFGSGCGTGTRSTTGQACCRSSRRRPDAACTAACPSATTAARSGALFPNGTILSGAATGRPRANGCTSPTTFPSSPAGSARPCASLPACWRLTSAR